MASGIGVDTDQLRDAAGLVDSAAGQALGGEVASADQVGHYAMQLATNQFAVRWSRGVNGLLADIEEFSQRLSRTADLYEAGDLAAQNTVTGGHGKSFG